jgi:hypothetical protein
MKQAVENGTLAELLRRTYSPRDQNCRFTGRPVGEPLAARNRQPSNTSCDWRDQDMLDFDYLPLPAISQAGAEHPASHAGRVRSGTRSYSMDTWIEEEH